MSFLCSFVIIAFLCSIPFGLAISTIGYNIDPRKHYSCNIGMSNVWRCCGTFAGVLTLLCDLGKATLALWLCSFLKPQYMHILAFSCVFFHCFSIYLHGKGGKGVASAGGVLLFFSYPTILIAASIWLTIRYIQKQASLASLGATLSALLYVAIYQKSLFVLVLAMSFLIIWRHADNFSRIKEKRELHF